MMKQKILSLAKSLGIEKCGFSENSFVALFPYYAEDSGSNISMYARGADYHSVVRTRLKPIQSALCAEGSESEIHVDNGRLNDRRAAYEAGLGFFGKNGMLICREYGSYFFIGQVTHTLPIERDRPLRETCMNCGRCIEDCIGGALGADGSFDVEKCVSHISQKRGELTEHEEQLILKSGLCWGCDRCQTVCPHNRGLTQNALPEFLNGRITRLEEVMPDGMSNREFMRRWGGYAFAWRGRSVLARNLKIFQNAEKCNEQK